MMILIFLLDMIFPGGDMYFVNSDGAYQYIQYHTYLGKILKTGWQTYSFKLGLGDQLMPTIAYYCASPDNLLLAVIPSTMVPYFLNITSILKIGLTGLFSYLCLTKYANKKEDQITVILSITYALSSGVLVYWYNYMWQNSIMILPLIALGIKKLVRERKVSLYMISLFLGIWCNYYIGIILCIFSILYLIATIIKEQSQNKEIVFSKFFFGSLFAGLGCAVLIFPSIQSLAYASGGLKSELKTSVSSVLRLMVGVFPFSSKDFFLETNAFIFCGCISVLLLILYLTNGMIKKRNKIVMMMILGLLYSSFYIDELNLVWHGFHVPNALPARFSFVFCFFITEMMVESWQFRKGWNRKFLIPGYIAVSVLFVAIAIVYHKDISWIPVLVGILLMGLYVFLIYKKKHICQTLLIILIGLELIVNGCYLLWDNKIIDNIKSDIIYIQNIEEKNNELIYRKNYIEEYESENFNVLSGADGCAVFNSTINFNPALFINKLGGVASINHYSSQSSPVIVRELLGVQSDIFGSGKEHKETKLNALSIAYQLPELQGKNPVERINNLAKTVTGTDASVLEEYNRAEDEKSTKVKLGKKRLYFLNKQNCAIELHYYNRNGKKIGMVRHLLKNNSFQELYYSGATSVIIKSFTTKYVGSKEKKTTIKNKGIIYEYQKEAADCCIKELKKTELHLIKRKESFATTSLTGTVTMKNTGNLFTTIPYDADWTVLIDGKDITKVYESLDDSIQNRYGMLNFKVPQGTHEITFIYHSKILVYGLIVSIIAWVCMVIMSVSEVVRRKK